MKSLPVSFKFSENEKKELYNVLISNSTDPYINVESFKESINEMIESNKVPTWFLDLCQSWKEEDHLQNPFLYLKNAPIDQHIPKLDFANPVISKYRLKTTSVSESFLELFSQLCGQESIGYKFVNTGDIYQDIHPMKRLKNTQSQKSIVNLGFHKDLANHFVRPDFVNIIGLRALDSNKVFTTFVKNHVLIDELDKLKLIPILNEEMFYTPFDDLTKDGDKSNSLGKANNHRILYDDGYNISFFEGRTKGLTQEAQFAVDRIVELLHKLKKGVLFGAGDFVSSENNKSIHGKEIHEVNSETDLQNRWLMKTVNVISIDKHREHLLEGKKYIING